MKTTQFLLFALVLAIWALPVKAQTTLSEQEAIELAIKQSHLLNAADLEILRQNQLAGASFNLPNPEVMIESPTGDFFTIGVMQSFEFPSVYKTQAQLVKQHGVLAEKERGINEWELMFQIKMLYLDVQTANTLLGHLEKQDSIYLTIATAAARQFDAGQIDFVAKTYAATAYSEVHNQFVQQKADANIAMQQLQMYTGITDSIVVMPLPDTANLPQLPNVMMASDSTTLLQTPLLQYYTFTQQIAATEVRLQQKKALPGFSIGYMNQGIKSTPFQLRFRAGITIPVWFWQYRSTINAAKTNEEIARQKTMAQQQQLAAKLNRVKEEALKFKKALLYYQTTTLRQADELVTASGRMFAAGQIDLVTHLRTISDVGKIKFNYIDTFKKYMQALVSMQYLNGNG